MSGHHPAIGGLGGTGSSSGGGISPGGGSSGGVTVGGSNGGSLISENAGGGGQFISGQTTQANPFFNLANQIQAAKHRRKISRMTPGQQGQALNTNPAVAVNNPHSQGIAQATLPTSFIGNIQNWSAHNPIVQNFKRASEAFGSTGFTTIFNQGGQATPPHIIASYGHGPTQ